MLSPGASSKGWTEKIQKSFRTVSEAVKIFEQRSGRLKWARSVPNSAGWMCLWERPCELPNNRGKKSRCPSRSPRALRSRVVPGKRDGLTLTTRDVRRRGTKPAHLKPEFLMFCKTSQRTSKSYSAKIKIFETRVLLFYLLGIFLNNILIVKAYLHRRGKAGFVW